ncbi:MAG: SRPBCC domain-containing protein [Myxococcota bacterium]
MKEAVVVIDEKLPLVRIVREFDAPPAKVFRAHVEPELFARWNWPEGYEVRFDQFDCRTGGAYRITMSGPEMSGSVHGSFHDVIPNELIVQTFAADGFPDCVVLERHRFEALADGRTRLTAQVARRELRIPRGLPRRGARRGLRAPRRPPHRAHARLSRQPASTPPRRPATADTMWWWLWLACTTEHARWQSPDGRFEVVASRSVVSGCIPVSPGQGSDAPGRVEVVRLADGRSCGSVRVPMVWMNGDVRFDGDTATIPALADWDLLTCTVTTYDR